MADMSDPPSRAQRSFRQLRGVCRSTWSIRSIHPRPALTLVSHSVRPVRPLPLSHDSSNLTHTRNHASLTHTSRPLPLSHDSSNLTHTRNHASLTHTSRPLPLSHDSSNLTHTRNHASLIHTSRPLPLSHDSSNLTHTRNHASLIHTSRPLPTTCRSDITTPIALKQDSLARSVPWRRRSNNFNFVMKHRARNE
jgi:hypothetical protein